jgi:hypothetical protein
MAGKDKGHSAISSVVRCEWTEDAFDLDETRHDHLAHSQAKMDDCISNR